LFLLAFLLFLLRTLGTWLLRLGLIVEPFGLFFLRYGRLFAPLARYSRRLFRDPIFDASIGSRILGGGDDKSLVALRTRDPADGA